MRYLKKFNESNSNIEYIKDVKDILSDGLEGLGLNSDVYLENIYANSKKYNLGKLIIRIVKDKTGSVHRDYLALASRPKDISFNTSDIQKCINRCINCIESSIIGRVDVEFDYLGIEKLDSVYKLLELPKDKIIISLTINILIVENN